MDYIQILQEKLTEQSQESNIRKLIDEKFFELEPKILSMNIEQIEDHTGSDGQRLKNDNSKYSGVYSETTFAISLHSRYTSPYPLLPKNTGMPYNWVWTGDFLGNFKMRPVAQGFEIYSTGTGSGDKKAFFDGYKNLYGLIEGDKNIIYTEVLNWVYETIMLKVYE